MSSIPSQSIDSTAAAPLRRTPLYDLHVASGAKMVPFAGYEMPVQYPPGVIKEHLHTRTAAGLFDVSHMGQITLRPRSGSLPDAAAALEQLVPTDVIGLASGRQRYTVLTNPRGGILDDLMVANVGDRLLLVVNAATKAADEAHLRAHLAATCLIEPAPERALLALQGPRAETVLADHDRTIPAMKFMDVRPARIAGVECLVSRSGYTGEDGFEIGLPGDAADGVARALLRHDAVALIGLAARDSLRLEAGLCLYGSDLDTDTDPVAAALEWSIPKSRRAGGSRAGGFPGADVVLAALASEASGQRGDSKELRAPDTRPEPGSSARAALANGPRRRRVGLRPEGRAPVRAGAPLHADADAGAPIGIVTSGGYGPSVSAPIAMGYVESAHAAPGTRLFATVRGARLPVVVAPMPFVPHTYKRG